MEFCIEFKLQLAPGRLHPKSKLKLELRTLVPPWGLAVLYYLDLEEFRPQLSGYENAASRRVEGNSIEHIHWLLAVFGQ